MNPQNQKQPCEPGRVARFADRWSQPAIGSNRNLGLGMGMRMRMSNGMSLAALVLGTAGSALAADLTVSMMPSHHQNEHYAKAVVGQPIQVWGKVSGDDYAGYTIDFGDGSAPATGDSVLKPEFINSLHSYTRSGTFVASLSVTNTSGLVFDRKVNIKVVALPSEQDNIDIAVEKGLLNLYGKASGLPESCTFSGMQTSEHETIAATAAAVLAFEENGHLPTNDPVADIYQNLVKKGWLYLKGQAEGPEYYQTRSFVLSTLALIQAMPRDPNAAGFRQRWIGPEGYFIRSRIGKVISAYNPNRSPYKGWTDDLSDASDSIADSEASEWVSYLLWKYDDVQTLFPSHSGDMIESTWSIFSTMPTYSVDMLNGITLYQNELLKRGYPRSDVDIVVIENFLNAWSLEFLQDPNMSWFGRIHAMHFLGKVSHLLPNVPEESYYQDWQRLMSGWLLGKNDLTGYDRLTGTQGAVGPSNRVPGMLYGQNADGSWSGPQLLPPNDVVSSPVATTALAVSTLIREDVTPSNDQIHAEYGSNFVSVSGGDNRPPIFEDGSNFSSDGTLTFSVSDADNDLININFVLDGLQDGTTQVNGGGSVNYKGTHVDPLYGTNSVVVKIGDGWSENYKTWLIERADAIAPYFKNTPPSITIPTAPGRATAAHYPLVYAYDKLGDGSETVIVPKVNVSYGEELSIGLHRVIATATDPAGNQATVEYTVTVVDQELPTVSQPAGIVGVASPTSSTADILLPLPDAQDNSGVVTWEYRNNNALLCSSLSPESRTVKFPIGSSTVMLNVSDSSTNTVSKWFVVNIGDATAPTLIKPADITVNSGLIRNYGKCSLPIPVVTDNSGSVSWAYTWGSTSYTSAGVGAAVNIFPMGITPITLTATDPSGNKTSCIVNVTVVDNEAPVINPIMPFSVRCDLGRSYATISDSLKPVINATDNSGIPPLIVQKYPVNNQLPIGTNTIVVTATDRANNVSTNSYIVLVVDDQAPVITGSMASITTTTLSGSNIASVPLTPAAATDNSGQVSKKFVVNNVDYPVSGTSTAVVLPIGTNVVSYVVSDPSRNTATRAFTVTVLDKEAPKFFAMPRVSVPALGASSVLLTNSDVIAKLLAAGAVITDNDGKIPTLSINRVSPSAFNLGDTVVTVTARDSSGNTAFSTFTVYVY